MAPAQRFLAVLAALMGACGVALAAALGIGWAVFCRRQMPLRVFAVVPL